MLGIGKGERGSTGEGDDRHGQPVRRLRTRPARAADRGPWGAAPGTGRKGRRGRRNKRLIRIPSRTDERPRTGSEGDKPGQITPSATIAPIASTAATASAARSATGTSPRCRAGVSTRAPAATPPAQEPRRPPTPPAAPPHAAPTPPCSGSPLRPEPQDQSSQTRAPTPPPTGPAPTRRPPAPPAPAAPSRPARWTPAPLPGGPVEQPHHALDDGDVTPRAPCANNGATSSAPHRYASRFRPTRPVASP